jgi:hypothetical protein
MLCRTRWIETYKIELVHVPMQPQQQSLVAMVLSGMRLEFGLAHSPGT